MLLLSEHQNNESLSSSTSLSSGGEDGGGDEEAGDSWSLTTQCLVGVPLAVIIAMSVAGNLLVCLAIYTDRRLRKLGNLFLVSLALADLFVSSLVMTFAVPNDLTGRWLFGRRFCDTWIAFDVMCSTASILNLCAISLDRFIHIKDPLRYSRWMSRRTVLAAIAAIWLASALVSFLPISLGWHRPGGRSSSSQVDEEDGDEMTCALELTPLYAVVSSIISFYAPCVVMVALYTRLYLYARRHVRDIRAVTKASSSCHHHHQMEHKAAITLGFIMGTFLVCWVPFFCVNIVAAVCKTCISDVVFKFLTWLGYCNSALNPVIYSIFNTEFREAFGRILLQADCRTSRLDRRNTATTMVVGKHHRSPPPSASTNNHNHNHDPVNRIEMRGEWSGKSSDV